MAARQVGNDFAIISERNLYATWILQGPKSNVILELLKGSVLRLLLEAEVRQWYISTSLLRFIFGSTVQVVHDPYHMIHTPIHLFRQVSYPAARSLRSRAILKLTGKVSQLWIIAILEPVLGLPPVLQLCSYLTGAISLYAGSTSLSIKPPEPQWIMMDTFAIATGAALSILYRSFATPVARRPHYILHLIALSLFGMAIGSEMLSYVPEGWKPFNWITNRRVITTNMLVAIGARVGAVACLLTLNSICYGLAKIQMSSYPIMVRSCRSGHLHALRYMPGSYNRNFSSDRWLLCLCFLTGLCIAILGGDMFYFVSAGQQEISTIQEHTYTYPAGRELFADISRRDLKSSPDALLRESRTNKLNGPASAYEWGTISSIETWPGSLISYDVNIHSASALGMWAPLDDRWGSLVHIKWRREVVDDPAEYQEHGSFEEATEFSIDPEKRISAAILAISEPLVTTIGSWTSNYPFEWVGERAVTLPIPSTSVHTRTLNEIGIAPSFLSSSHSAYSQWPDTFYNGTWWLSSDGSANFFALLGIETCSQRIPLRTEEIKALIRISGEHIRTSQSIVH